MIKNNKVTLLNNIEVDKQLPKYLKILKNKENDTPLTAGTTTQTFFTTASLDDLENIRTQQSENNFRDIYMTLGEQAFYTKSISDKIKTFIFKNVFGKEIGLLKKSVKDISLQKLQQFFESIKGSVNILKEEEILDIVSNYQIALTNAHINGQVALSEKIKDYATLLSYELILATSKFNRFIDEKDLVEFYNIASFHEKFKTNLKLTYIKNFIKIIPLEVSILKNEADELLVFDNYVILHYDYDGSSTADTKEEIEKKKDPILFGVLKGSKRLYYIGDWIDEYCDLTLEGVIKTLGKEVGVLDFKTVDNGVKGL